MAYVKQMSEDYPYFREKKEEGTPVLPRIQEAFQESPAYTAPQSTAKEYTLLNVPIANSERVYKNGLLMRRNSGSELHDYKISGNKITFEEAPGTGSVVIVNYRYE